MPDSEYVLFAYRVPDHNNDGSWRRQEIWLESMDGRVQRMFGVGSDASFSPDGKHVLWLQPSQKSEAEWKYQHRDLMQATLAGRKRIRLASNVDAFAVGAP